MDSRSKRLKRHHHTRCTCQWGAFEPHRFSLWCQLPEELQAKFAWQLLKGWILAEKSDLCLLIKLATFPLYFIHDHYYEHIKTSYGFILSTKAKIIRKQCDGYLAWDWHDHCVPISPSDVFAWDVPFQSAALTASNFNFFAS